MPEFLAETYAPRGAAAPSAANLARAAWQVSSPGAPARFLDAIAVPGEETCFYLYQAPPAAAARAAMTCARLRPYRITPAMPLPPPPPARPGGAPAVGAGADDGTIQQFKAGFSALAAQPVAMAVILFRALGSAVYGAPTVLRALLSAQLGAGASGYSYPLAGPGGSR
jgi:hypothetical protein